VGRTELRRLSNRELSHTIRDLLGADVARDLDLVVDEVFRGFDTVAAVQTTSLLHVERYAALAERLADAAVSGDLGVVRHEVEALDLPVGASHEFALGNETWWSFVGPSEADSSFALEVPEAGDYTLTAQAVWVVGWAAEGSELAPPSLSVEVGEVALPAQPILATFDVGEALTWDVTLPAGTTTVALHFDQLPQTYGVALDFVELRPATRRGWLQCDAAAIGEESCAREVLGTWMPRAWRRPVTPVEVDARIGLIATARAAGLSFEDALAQALQTVFLSPYFLYLPEPTGEIDPGTERPLDPHELASRLSYLVWSSMPDEALRACADAGELVVGDGPCGLDTQLERMLADPKADALAEDFGAQWLQLGRLVAANPDPARFDFDDALADAMAEQTRRVLVDAFRSETPVASWMTETQTWVGGPLAAHYGLEGDDWREVSLPERPGLLGHASILTLTSNPTRSSPVHRGLWVLGRLLCDEPDPAPPDAPPLDEAAAVGSGVREVVAAHGANPGCAACHQSMDPIGLALEHFDAVGVWRDTWEDGVAVDASGVLPDGQALADHHDLATVLAAHPDLQRCVREHLFTWAMGRAVGEGDRCVVDRQNDDGTLAGMVRGLVASPGFHRVVAEEAP
jgi:hypothetical protein